MVLETSNNNQKLYQCQECGLHYTNESIAKKCEEFCAKYKSCNLEITKEAVEVKEVN